MTQQQRPGDRPEIRLFLDSADREAWARWLPTGLFYGVTTNPTILRRAGLRSTIAEIAALAREALAYPIVELHAQCWGRGDALAATGVELAALDPRLVVKVPLTLDGIRAVAALRGRAVRTTLTALYAPHQALTAAAAGADYAAPYLGRIADAGGDGFAAVREMRTILERTGDRTRLLVASIRSAPDLAALAAAGCDTFTIGPAVADELFADPLTLAAVDAFEAAAAP